MLLKAIISILVTFFVSSQALAEQKGSSLLTQANAPQTQIEWFIDLSQASSWSFNLKGTVDQLVGRKGVTGMANYKARVVDRSTGQSVIDWQGSDRATSLESSFYFLLVSGDPVTVARLQNPSDDLEIEISYQAVKGTLVTKNYLQKISLKQYCESQADKVLQPFTGETGCFHQVSQAAITGQCSTAEEDMFCNSAFNDKRQDIGMKLGCNLACK